MNLQKAIIVWAFNEAPPEYRELSPHGGDEDWIALVPFEKANDYIGWLEEGTSFGCCSVSKHAVETGVIFIGAHA
jgi:hypothetical protein